MIKDMFTQYEAITIGTFTMCAVLSLLYMVYYLKTDEKKGN